jgi:hypothetical protein
MERVSGEWQRYRKPKEDQMNALKLGRVKLFFQKDANRAITV